MLVPVGRGKGRGARRVRHLFGLFKSAHEECGASARELTVPADVIVGLYVGV